MFTLSILQGEWMCRKAAPCSESFRFGDWAVVRMAFSKFKVKLVSPREVCARGEQSVLQINVFMCLVGDPIL